MIEKLTVGDISAAVLFVVALIGGIGYLKGAVKKWLTKLLEDQFKVLASKIDDIESTIKRLDNETCKNFLVRYLADVEHGNLISDAETQRFWEEYEHYLKNGGNSYIKEWVEKLRKKGYL